MDEIRIPIDSDSSIVVARQRGRELAGELGMNTTDMTLVATAISEMARNIVLYARRGEIFLRVIVNPGKSGIEIMARDDGPGIFNVSQAMQEGYSTSRSLGLGLPGIRRLMDEFDIVSEVGRGTTVTVKKWKR